jgi:hypothetical protein
VRVLAVSLLALLFSVAVPASASARSLRGGAARRAPEPAPVRGTRVSVQPIGGEIGPAVRAQVARLLQHRGFRVLTSVPAASGTSQYPGLARENRLAAFVVADVTERGRSATVTFLVWSGEDGGVIGRWSVWAGEKKLGKAIAKGFWKNLGRALAEAKAPPSDDAPPPPVLRIDAGSPLDESIVSDDGFSSRRAPILR